MSHWNLKNNLISWSKRLSYSRRVNMNRESIKHFETLSLNPQILNPNTIKFYMQNEFVAYSLGLREGVSYLLYTV